MTLNKILLPAVIGVIVGISVVGWWVTEIIHLSYRTEGTTFSKYSTAYPGSKNPHPSQISFCDPQYKMRWVGCGLK